MLIGRPARDSFPIRELRDASKFDRVVRARPGQRARVVIQLAPPARPGAEPEWWDHDVFWEGPYTGEHPLPSPAYLTAVGRSMGAAHVRSVVQADI